MKRNWKILPIILLTLVVGLLAAGCQAQSTDDRPVLEIRDGWARTKASEAAAAEAGKDAWKTPVGPLGLGPNGLIFITIENKGGKADRLVAASSSAAEKVELHQMILTDQSTSTRAVAGIDLPAKTVTQLQSGGAYIRLVGLKENLADGATFDLTLEFEESEKSTVKILVANP
jgi:copper(I)-binding protein